MSFESMGPEALDYFLCQYGTSKLPFRGPKRGLEGDYVTFLGGIETYGKFVQFPYPNLVEQETGLKSVNLGLGNVGVEIYLRDKSLLKICSGGLVTVLQIVGALNVSNKFFTVHPRRNDRFITASEKLRELYPEIDFTDISFTRHLLLSLLHADAARFGEVELELKAAWKDGMVRLIEEIGGPVVLLWLTDHEPGSGLEGEPIFVDYTMLEEIAPHAERIVKVIATRKERARGLSEMVFNDLEEPAAAELLGATVHRRAAMQLAPVLVELQKQKRPRTTPGPQDTH